MTAILENAPTCNDTTTRKDDYVHAIAEVSGADLQVPLVHGGTCRYANFDYAASAPALRAVTDRIAEQLPFYSSVHRGAGYASRVTTDAYENARRTVARFAGAERDSVVIFTRNTTDSLNLLAGCVPGDTVVLDIEHHATLLPWRNRRVVAAAATIEETLTRIDKELQAKPAALLAVTGASNVTGEILPIEKLADIAHRNGARIVVDGAQLVPHRPVDIEESCVDYLVFSGHKLYAPFGAGVLVGKRDWLDAGEPYLKGGGAVRTVTTEHTEWAPAPQRHEAGTPNVLGAVALAAACDAISELGFDAIAQHETALADRLKAGLAAIPGVGTLSIWGADSVGIVTFDVDGFGPGEVAAYLSAEHGIGVRDGKFCAHPLLAKLGHPGGAVRASLGLGSCSQDVDKLIGAIEQLVENGPAWNYTEESGWWNPVPDPRAFPSAGRSKSDARHPISSAVAYKVNL